MEVPHSKVIRIGELELRFLVDETQGSGDLVIFEFTIPPQARVPAPHFHRDVDEAVYGVEGTLTMTLDGRKQELRPGEVMFIPRGSVHHHENVHAETARALVVLNPGSIGRRYFDEIAEAVNVQGKPDSGRIEEIMRRHGLIPA
jgi:quercetin dioxygenase-like cupin family protein